MDVKEAFLNAELKEKIYINVPSGFRTAMLAERPDMTIYQHAVLHKALYGLKQESRAFFMTTRDALLNMGFVQDLADCCLFKRDNLIVGLYVDDLIVTGETVQVEEFKKEFVRSTGMEIRIDENMTEFVGMELTWITPTSVRILQREVLDRLIILFASDIATNQDYRRKVTPAIAGSTVIIREEDDPNLLPPDRQRLYRSAVGIAMYLTRFPVLTSPP